MEPARILPLLASLQMLPWPVSPEAWPSASELTVNSQHRIFLHGESVTLTCSAPSTDTMSWIWFFRDGDRIDPGEPQRSQYRVNASLLLLSVSETDTGQYSCESWKTKTEQVIASERSQTISIRVTARMPAPTLTVSSQYHVFLRGESVTLTCSAPSTDTVTGIRFFRDGQKINSGELQRYQYNARSHQLSIVSETDAGVYSCESWKNESGREIPSERSQTISITVTARPPAPELTVSSQHRVFLPGEFVTLMCSAPSTDTASGIRFFKDGQSIDSRELQRYSYYVRSLQLLRVSESHAGVYSCDYLKTESGREIPSERSQNIPIAVTARPSAPELTVNSQYHVFLPGESVTLTCSAPSTDTVSGMRFFRSGQSIDSRELQRYSYKARSLQLSSVSESHAGVYSCDYLKTESGREIPSERSQTISITVTDPPPQPELSVDPPSGAVSEGFPLNITCMAPKDARKRRFHFYKDGVELIPGDLGSEISTMEPSNSSVKCSVLSIPWAGSNITGEFACRYEENVSGRWILSPRSWTVNVTGNITVSGHGFRWIRELAVGGSFFLINGIIFLISCCYF